MANSKTFAVYWSKNAASDLDLIMDYLSIESLAAADHVLAKIERAASNLISFPYRGRIVPELKEHGIVMYHELICAPWRIIYRIEGRIVRVAAVVDSRRNFEDLLFEKFLQ